MSEPTYEQLRRENERLRRRVAELEPLHERVGQLEAQNQRLQKQLERLAAELEKVRRQGQRQAAPFSQGRPKQEPRKPGRKPGKNYGRKVRRQPPRPEQIDETYHAPLPESCPDCGGSVEETDVRSQYQVEIPRRPIHREFRVHIGWCPCCAQRLQGRHELQTSDALGAAAAQLGPNAQAALVLFNKRAGLSHGKGVDLLKKLFGIRLSRGGSAHVILRAGRRCEPAYGTIEQSVRESSSNSLDETGWKIGGRPGWLHTITNARATWYGIAESRSAQVTAAVLGWDWAGVLIHDGFSSYDGFENAWHQQCLRHALRRARDLLKTARGGAVHVPRAVIGLLTEALRLRDRFAAGEISARGRTVRAGRLRERLRRLVTPIKTHRENERLAAHLERYLPEWFTFLWLPGVEATNYRAEQALRPAVANRKVWGGNRTRRGARAQAVLMSVLQTAHQQTLCPLDWLVQTLCGKSPPLIMQPV